MRATAHYICLFHLMSKILQVYGKGYAAFRHLRLMSSHQFSSQVLMDFLQYWFGEFYNFKLEHYSRKIMEIMEDLP